MKILLRLLTLLGPYKGRAALAATSVLLSSGFTLVTPRLVSWAVDFGIVQSKNNIEALVIVALAIFALRSAGTFSLLLRLSGRVDRAAGCLRPARPDLQPPAAPELRLPRQGAGRPNHVARHPGRRSVRMYVNQGNLRCWRSWFGSWFR